MKKHTEELEKARLAAEARGDKRYNGYACSDCGCSERFVTNNACAECKREADRSRYYRVTVSKRYMVEGTDCMISDHANRTFLSALAKEKSGWKDE